MTIDPKLSVGAGTYTGTDPLLTINANTGDAGLRFQVNNTSANAWDFIVDNSDSDKFEIRYGGTESISFRQGAGSTVLHLSPGNITAATAPSANTIYPNTIIKGWALLDCGAAGAVTVLDGVNVDSASYSTVDMTVELHTAMASSTYAVMVTNHTIGVTNATFSTAITDEDTFVIRKADNGTGASTNYTSSDVISIMILGEQ
jgi:hypothetical protein